MIYAFIIMGVSGSGKTTVGQALAKQVNGTFYDGDDYHPDDNIEKMSNGIPLTDQDRIPWLNCLRDLIQDHITQKTIAVIACSALKQSYRERLTVDAGSIQFVYLRASYDVIWERMQTRDEHYMKPEMLKSQFDALEPPTLSQALIIDAEQAVDRILETITQHITQR